MLATPCELLTGTNASTAVPSPPPSSVSSDTDAEAWVQMLSWIAIVALVLCSALFCGLTLGLLGLDVNQLSVVISSGSRSEQQYARRIWPLRKRGNLLLCTLLMGNVAVNAGLSILLADKTSGLVGFLLSTSVIVLLGEIAPQAIISRHALLIGAHTVWLVWIFVVVFFPVAYPAACVLDFLLGQEIGTLYRKDELKSFLRIHARSPASNVTHGDERRLLGVLEFGSKQVQNVMTSMAEVFHVAADAVLDGEQMDEIIRSGYSRIPVVALQYVGSRVDVVLRVVGILHVKDLALLDRDDATAVTTILERYMRPLVHVWDDASLDVVLSKFKTEGSHIAVVRRVNADDADRDPFYEDVGIVTLEDVIEELLQEQFVDETDVYEDNRSLKVLKRRIKVDPSQISSTDVAASVQLMGYALPAHRRILSEREQKQLFICLRQQHEDLFAETIVGDVVLQNLIENGRVLAYSDHERAARSEYRYLFAAGDRKKLYVVIQGGLTIVNSGDAGRGQIGQEYSAGAKGKRNKKTKRQKSARSGQERADDAIPVEVRAWESLGSDSLQGGITGRSACAEPPASRLFAFSAEMLPGTVVFCISPNLYARAVAAVNLETRIEQEHRPRDDSRLSVTDVPFPLSEFASVSKLERQNSTSVSSISVLDLDSADTRATDSDDHLAPLGASSSSELSDSTELDSQTSSILSESSGISDLSSS